MFFLFVILLNASGWAESANPRLAPSLGYTQDVKKEKTQVVTEMVLPKEPPEQSVLLKDILFDPTLDKEFRDEYRKRFGQTDAEINFNAGSLNVGTSRFGDYYMYYGPGRGTSFITDEELIVRQKSFADYMMRRMFEYHGDRYARSRQDLRAAYEVKEKVANVQVAVKKGYKFKINYSYSGKHLDMKLENPFDIGLEFRYDLNPAYVTPSGKDYIIKTNYEFNPRIRADAQYAVEDGVMSLSGWRKLTRRTGLTATYSTFFNNSPSSIRQTLYLIGFVWTE